MKERYLTVAGMELVSVVQLVKILVRVRIKSLIKMQGAFGLMP